jgi:hypothetical protein
MEIIFYSMRLNEIRVDDTMPNTTLAASGINTWACKLVSDSKGSMPAMVVIEVRKIARKRSRTASSDT